MYFSDVGNKSAQEIYIKPTPSTTKIRSTIGKKNNTVVSGRPTKPKKFVPPTKSTPYKVEQKKQECIDSIPESSNTNILKCNTTQMVSKSKGRNSNRTTSKGKTNSLTQPLKTMNNDLNVELQCTQEMSLIQYDNSNNNYPSLPTLSSNFDEIPASFGYLSLNSEIGNTGDNSTIQPGDTELGPKKRSKKDPNIAGVILGSLNVLNDEEFPLSENLSQETQSDQSSVKNLSRIQSFCSVTSLKKVYKNLDDKSFENDLNFEPKNEDRKIPEGDEYLKLFKNKPTKKKSRKFPPMSIEFGDIGFNKKYSDYIKDVGFIPQQMQSDENDTFMKILEMYPNDNEIFIKMKFPK